MSLLRALLGQSLRGQGWLPGGVQSALAPLRPASGARAHAWASSAASYSSGSDGERLGAARAPGRGLASHLRDAPPGWPGRCGCRAAALSMPR
jgi:hypothetical protein